LSQENGPRHEPQRRYAAKRFAACTLELVRKAPSSWLMAGVILTPRHAADASTSTANIRLKPDFLLTNRGSCRVPNCAAWSLDHPAFAQWVSFRMRHNPVGSLQALEKVEQTVPGTEPARRRFTEALQESVFTDVQLEAGTLE
jgi:hypothetical protein